MSKLINVTRTKWTGIPNEVFFDKRLDYRTRGLLCTILSLPDGWDFSVAGLASLVTPKDDQGNINKEEKGEGKDAITVCLKKLEKYGYLQRIRTTDKKGLFTGYDYQVNIPPIVIVYE